VGARNLNSLTGLYMLDLLDAFDKDVAAACVRR
jgi:hypothetical protein